MSPELPTAAPGYLSQALVLAYVALSLGVFAVLAARRGARADTTGPVPYVLAAGLALGAAAAAVAGIVECHAWLVRGATAWGVPEPGGAWLGSMPAEGYVLDCLAFWYVALTLCVFAVLFLRRQRGRASSPARLVAGNALVLAALLAVVFVVAETYLRYVYDATMTYGLSLTQRAWEIRHWRVNRFGFRDRDWHQEKGPGVERVVFVGDSIVAGFGVDRADERLSGVVARELERRSPGGFDVWTAGIPGWTTGHELEWLQRTLPGSGVDRVVVGFCLNDAKDLLPAESVSELSETMRRPFWVDPGQSFVFDTVWWLTASRRMEETVVRLFEREKQAFRDDEPWRKQLARMRGVRDACRKNGARLAVVVFPDVSTWGDPYPFDDVHDSVGAAWRDLGARVIDLRTAWRGVAREELAAGRYDPHPSARAHALAAEAVLAELFRTP